VFDLVHADGCRDGFVAEGLAGVDGQDDGFHWLDVNGFQDLKRLVNDVFDRLFEFEP
jgi:hypothetical protein